MGKLTKLFNRKNTLAILLIIAAILGTLGIPQKLGFSPEQLILSLLALLAVDTIIERLGYLDLLEKQVAEINSKIEPKSNVDNIFGTRDSLPSFIEWLSKGEEIWMAGESLRGLMISFGGHIEKAALEGKKFRFIIINPENTNLLTTLASSSLTQPDPLEKQSLIKHSIAQLMRMRENSPKGSIEVRVINGLLENAYIIKDGQKTNGEMIIEFFSYKISSSDRLHLTLSKSKNPKIFKYYIDRFDAMWKDALPISE